METSTRITLGNVALGFAVGLTALAVSAAALTTVALFILSLPQAIIIGGIVATAVLASGAAALFASRYLLLNRAASKAPPITASPTHLIKTASLPSLPPESMSKTAAYSETSSADGPTPLDSSPQSITVPVSTSRLISTPLPIFTTTILPSIKTLTVSLAPKPRSRMILTGNFPRLYRGPYFTWNCPIHVLRTAAHPTPHLILPPLQKTAYTVEEPDDNQWTIVPAPFARPLSEPLIEEIEELPLNALPTPKAADLSIVHMKPKNRNIPAPILTFAVALGAAAQNAGVGAIALETAVGAYFMSTMVNPTSWALTRYIAAQAARTAASSLITTPILGVSLPLIANLGFAIATAIAASHAGIFLYNSVTSKDNRLLHSGAALTVALHYLGLGEKEAT